MIVNVRLLTVPILSSRANSGVTILLAFSTFLLFYKSIAFILADKFELVPKRVSERMVNNIFILIGLMVYGIGVGVYFYVSQNPNWITVVTILLIVIFIRITRDFISRKWFGENYE